VVRNLLYLVRIIAEVRSEKMIKVLEKGSERKFIVECPKCSSKLEYAKSDLFYHSGCGGNDTYSIECPECDFSIYIEK